MPKPDPFGPPNEHERLHWTEVGEAADEHEAAPRERRKDEPRYLLVDKDKVLLVAPGVPLRVA